MRSSQKRFLINHPLHAQPAQTDGPFPVPPPSKSPNHFITLQRNYMPKAQGSTNGAKPLPEDAEMEKGSLKGKRMPSGQLSAPHLCHPHTRRFLHSSAG